VSATTAERSPQLPCPGPLGYSRFSFSDPFLSLFFIRPLADRDIFLFSGACVLYTLRWHHPIQSNRVTYVAPLSFIPASSFRHNVTFMYGVLVTCTLSILSAHHRFRDPCGLLCLLFASCQCLCNHLHPFTRAFFLFPFIFDLILQRTHLIVLK
jgi:hypothetical protein